MIFLRLFHLGKRIYRYMNAHPDVPTPPCVCRTVAPKKHFFLPHHHFPPFPFFALKICTAAGFLWGRCHAQNVFCNIIRSLLGENIHYLRFCGPISPLFSKFLRSINCKIRGNEKCRMHLLPSKAARSTTFECRRNSSSSCCFFCRGLFFVSVCGKIRCRYLTPMCVWGFTAASELNFLRLFEGSKKRGLRLREIFSN